MVPLIWGAYAGYKRGLLVEIVAIVAFVLAVVLGFKMLDVGLKFLSPYISGSNRFLPYFAFSAIFFPIIFLVNRLGRMLRKSLRYTLIGSFDSMAGAMVGVLTWAFGISVFLWLINAVGIRIPLSASEDTFLYPIISPIAPTIISKASHLLPLGSDLIDSIKKALGKLNELK
jgi:membrane protein required for colicin V production